MCAYITRLSGLVPDNHNALIMIEYVVLTYPVAPSLFLCRILIECCMSLCPRAYNFVLTKIVLFLRYFCFFVFLEKVDQEIKYFLELFFSKLSRNDIKTVVFDIFSQNAFFSWKPKYFLGPNTNTLFFIIVTYFYLLPVFISRKYDGWQTFFFLCSSAQK